MAPDISEMEILDGEIGRLKDMAADRQLDFDERMQVTHALLKAINMRQKIRTAKKGKGFDLTR